MLLRIMPFSIKVISATVECLYASNGQGVSVRFGILVHTVQGNAKTFICIVKSSAFRMPEYEALSVQASQLQKRHLISSGGTSRNIELGHDLTTIHSRKILLTAIHKFNSCD